MRRWIFTVNVNQIRRLPSGLFLVSEAKIRRPGDNPLAEYPAVAFLAILNRRLRLTAGSRARRVEITLKFLGAMLGFDSALSTDRSHARSLFEAQKRSVVDAITLRGVICNKNYVAD